MCKCLHFALVSVLVTASPFKFVLSAEPSLRVGDVSVSALDTSFKVSFYLNTEDDVAAFTLVFAFDPQVLKVQDVIFPQDPKPEWSDYFIAEDWIASGWIMDFLPPYDGAVLPGGENVEVTSLLCELNAGTSPGTYNLHLPPEGRKAEGPLLRNSYTTKEGIDDIFPQLEDGTLTVTWPKISVSETSVTYADNLANLTIKGQGFIPQTLLRINGESREFQLLDSTALLVEGLQCAGEVPFELCNGDKCVEGSFVCGTLFRRGDVNADGSVDIADPILILGYLFSGAFVSCLDAADVNDDGVIDIADPIRVLAFLFAGAEPPPPPFQEPGLDPTEDPLDCESYGGP